MTERTITCLICGNPYVQYAFYAGDQSACPEYRAKVRKPVKKCVTDWRELYDIPTFQRDITLSALNHD